MTFITTIKESFSAKLLIGVILTWIVLAIIFAFADLYISIAVVDQNSLLGIFGRDFGEAPGWGLIGISISILIGSFIKDIKKQKLSALIVISIGLILVLYYLSEGSMLNVTNYSSMVIFTVIFPILTLNKDWSEYRIIAGIILTLAIINSLLFVQTVKILWGRVRFRDLLPDYSNFSPWFVPQGITGSKSFPSGHTAMGFMLLPLLILVKDRDLRDRTRISVTVAIIGWGIFVAYSRILIGAHYASDVLFSAGMASVITILLYELVNLKTKS